MGNLRFFENMIETKLLNLHTAYLAKVLSTDGETARIQPLGMSKAYGETAIKQSPLSGVPVLQSARYKIAPKEDITEQAEVESVVITPLAEGDIVLCVCCERDISQAKKGNNSTPVYGHHSMSSSVVVGIL